MPIKLNVGSQFDESDGDRVKREAAEFYARERFKIELKTEFDEASARATDEKVKAYFAAKSAKIKVETDVDHDTLTRAGTEAGEVFSQSMLKSLGTALPAGLGGQGGLAVAGTLLPTLIDLGKGAITASQSIALLPAVLGAAGAAFGTLTLATHGFSDALKDIGDPKKFAADLQSLAPNAQQAALSIQNLMPVFKDLQQATQNSFFAGIGEEIHKLTDEYLPEVKSLTTSIADSFNNMLKGVGNQLLTPDTQLQLQSMMTNISTAFQVLAPAAQSVVQAITDIASVGSSFLPGFATSIADAARSFAEFIRQARDSGQLKQFIQDGIDAVKEFGQALWNIGGILYKTFGVDGKQNVENLHNSLNDLTNAVGILGDAFTVVGSNGTSMADDIKKEIGDCTGAAGAFRDAILDIPEALTVVANKIIAFANLAIDKLNEVVRALNLLTFPGSPLGSSDLPGIPHLTSPADLGLTGGDWGSGANPPSAPTPNDSGAGHSGDRTRERRGEPPRTTPNAGLPSYPSLFPVPPPPPPAASGGSGGSGGSRSAAPAGLLVPANAAIAAIQFAQQQVGKPYGASAGPTFYDCSGFMSDIFAVMTGKPYQGSERYFTTEANFPSLGFEPGFQAGAFNIGVNSAAAGFGANAHMAGTLPNGVNVEAGGGPGGVKYGGTAKGAKDFAQIYHLRTDKSFNGAYGDVPGSDSSTGSSGTGEGIRVFVTNMPGSGFGAPGGPGGANGAGGPGSGVGPNGEFDPLGAFFSGLTQGGGIGGIAGSIGTNVLGQVRNATGNGTSSTGGGPQSSATGLGAPPPSIYTGAPVAPSSPGSYVGAGTPDANGEYSQLPYRNTKGWVFNPATSKWAPPGGARPSPAAPASAPSPAAPASAFGPLANAPHQWFDTGSGTLPPGVTIAHNNTGRPEPLVSPQHMANAAPVPPGAPGGPGSNQHTGSGAEPGPSQIGGGEPKNSPSGSAGGGGGLVGAATQAGAMAADAFAPGSGAAVQIASAEAQRAIKFAGQATAIGIGGVLDTLLPFGGSDLAQNNWLTKGASAFAGVQPQIPNTAGKSASVDQMQQHAQTAPPPPLGTPASGVGSGPPPGPTVVNNTFHVSNTGAANDTNETRLAGLVGKQYDSVGQR